MRLPEVMFFYLCVGLAVALRVGGKRRWLAVPLWPLFLPAVLAPADARFDTVPTALPSTPIAATFRRLHEALALWDPAPAVPLEATERALLALHRRREALSALLARPENAVDGAQGDVHRTRRQHLVALAALRDQLDGELDAALARMDELSTRIQLAHFGGRSLDDVGRQLADLVAVVDGMQAAHHELEHG